MRTVSFCLAVFTMISFNVQSQVKKQTPAKVVFAVINNGVMIEPVARMEDGKLLSALSDEETGMKMPAFAEQYYKPGTIYKLIGGGKPAGKVTVVKNDPEADCASIMAEVKTSSSVLKFNGFEMALATDISSSKPASGLRRTATAAEKAAIEKLVRAAFNRKIILTKDLKAMKLTVLDVDNDKIPEIVGTYRCTPRLNERAVLFFIAAKKKSGVYALQYSDINEYREDELMSQDITSIDDGVYSEMLLDILDTDNNGVSNIFTMTLSFEGAGFNIYHRKGSQWEKLLEVSNYHCGY